MQLFESFALPLRAWLSWFFWQVLMLPERQRLHCSQDRLCRSKNIDLFKCRNTVQESDSLKYAWGEVVAVVCFSIWKAFNMISIGNFKACDANIEMASYSVPKRDYRRKRFLLGLFRTTFWHDCNPTIFSITIKIKQPQFKKKKKIS